MKPEPGVYHDVPMSEYGSWDAANYSTLKKFDRSAAHAREMMVNPPDQTPAMRLGSAVHTAVLENELFKKEYVVAPKVDRRFKKDKIVWEKFLNDNKDREVLTGQEFEQCTFMSASARSNPLVQEILAEKGFTEMSFVWHDKDTGILCKGRVDRFGRLWGNSIIADLKTTENASEDSWKREVVKYQYHAQSAFYLDGLDTIAPVVDRKFLWIALEKTAPYAVALYEPDAATIDKGRRMYRKYLRMWGICQESGIWPGYAPGIQPLLLPDWALRQEEGEDEF
jgi:exodeoxyribonuclease VIII